MSQADDERIKRAKPDFERIERFLAFVRRIDIFADKGDIFALFDCSPAAPYPEIEGKVKTFRDYYQASGAKKFAELKKIVAQETQVILAILSDPVLREGYRFFSIERMLWSDFEVYTKRDKILDAKEEEDLIAEGKFLGLSEDEVSAIIQKWLDDPKIDVRKGERQTAGPSFSGSPKIDLGDLLGMTCFDVLGIPQNASYDQIKAARENKLNEIGLIRDKKKADAKRVLVEFAWECLKDPQKRREYDEKLKQPKTYAGTGDPRLVVECNTEYTFKNVRRGGIIGPVRIVIKNPDGGLLQGTIKSDVPWLEPDRNNVSEKHEQGLIITIVTSQIPTKVNKTSGTITIDTNGGKHDIPFIVFLENYKKELQRFQITYIPLVVSFFGLIGSFFGLLKFFILAGASGGIAFFMSKLLLDYCQKKGINPFKYPPVLIHSLSCGILALTFFININSGVTHDNAHASSETAKFLGVWEYEDYGSKQYLKIFKTEPGKLKLLKGYKYQGGIVWTEPWIKGIDGIYLTLINRQLKCKFVSSNFYATHGQEFIYEITIDINAENKLTYSVYCSIRKGETHTRIATRIIN